jgi:hypothetical protein
MAMNINGLREVRSARTGTFSVWADRSDLGLLYHQLLSVGAGSVYEMVCVSPGMATLATFLYRVDLPEGTRMIATDREFSTWTFNGVHWIPQNPTGILAVTAARNFSPADYGAVLTNSGGTNRALTLPTGLPSGFRCRLVQLNAGNLNVQVAAGVTNITAANANRTAAAGCVAELIKLSGETYVLTGDIGA